MLKKEMENNPKLKGLEGQIIEAYKDFEDMKRTREEARKQLEAKFQDIYKKIEKLKEAMDAETMRVNNSLKAFQNKFEFLINELTQNFNKQMNDEKDFIRNKFNEQENVMKKLEQMIIEEREERLRHSDEQLRPIKAHLQKLDDQHEQEKNDRIQGEKDLIRMMDDNVFEINENITKETKERETKITLMKEEFKQEINNRDNAFDEFKRKIMNEIRITKDEIVLEMTNRFSHQNEIIDNISNFLKTFQDTLKVVGKDV